jgi:hypothetical protein
LIWLKNNNSLPIIKAAALCMRKWRYGGRTMVTMLLSLLSRGSLPRSLSTILDIVLGGGPVRDRVEAALKRRLDEQAGRSAGRLLGRAICEQVDTAMETRSAGATVAQRIEVGTMLAQNAALQLARAAELLLAYPALQAAVVRAKEQGDAAALKAARTARNAGTQRVKQALVNVGRAAAGDVPGEV